MIRRILVPVRGDGKADSVLAYTAGLARGLNAHIKITHCHPRPEDILPFGVPMSKETKERFIQQSASMFDIEQKVLGDKILGLCKSLGIKISDKASSNQLTASITEDTGKQIDIVRKYGRLSDLIAVAQPDIDRNLGANTLKTALFHTARPVLMCPDTGGTEPKNINEHVALAWDGSLESTRAVALCLWIMKSAKKVSIITVDTSSVEIAAEELRDYLKEHDVKAESFKIKPSGGVSKTLLGAFTEIDADLAILGAYGSNQYFERAIGGVTQRFIDKASKPVILVH